MANKILTEGRRKQILSKGVKDMPQNPASQGYTKTQIRAFYYRPEEEMLEVMSQIEDSIVGKDGIDERVVSLEEKITGENGLESKVKTLETNNGENKKDIDALEEKTKILNVDQTKPNRFLSEDGLYKEIKECECVPIVVDKEINENSTNVVENKAIAKAMKGKQDKLTAGKNITIQDGVISAEGGSGGTNVEANPTEEATEDLSKLKVGEKVYSIPKEILQGETAPTTETVGELGQFYTDTTNGTSYQCTSIVDGVYTWVKLIRATDIAQQKGEAGLMKLGSNSNGLTLIDDILYIQPASLAGLEGQYGGYAPVTAERLAYGVKHALINPDKSKAPANWTDEERAKARETLGISGSGGTKLYKHTFELISKENDENGIVFATGSFYAITSDNLLEIDGQTLRISEENAKKITSPILINDDKGYSLIGRGYDNGGYEYGNTNNMLSDVLEVATGV